MFPYNWIILLTEGGSQLADSFENLSVISHCPNESSSSDYMNVKAVTAQLNKPVGRTRPILKPPSAIPPSRCAQIKELWTPPCSPDYRDHTTGYIEPFSAIGRSVQHTKPKRLGTVLLKPLL